MCDALGRLLINSRARQQESLPDLTGLGLFLEADATYADLTSMLVPADPLTWLAPGYISPHLPAAVNPCFTPAAPFPLSAMPDTLVSNTQDIALQLFSPTDQLQLDAALMTDLLQPIPNFQHSSISSLDTLATDMLSLNDDSDVSSDRVASPIDWPSLHEEDQRGTDLLASLTQREREMLHSKGLNVYSNLPLTKDEEKKIRAERRKIRNKDSAKESRRKKTEYIQLLEKRAEASEKLKQRCTTLEKENAGLMRKLAQMQEYIASLTRTLPSSGTGLPLMMLLMTFCFVFTPSFLTGFHEGLLMDPQNMDAVVKSRVLLSVPDVHVDAMCADAAFDTMPLLRQRRRVWADRFSWLNNSVLSSQPMVMPKPSSTESVAHMLENGTAAQDSGNDTANNETEQAPTPDEVLIPGAYLRGEGTMATAHLVLRDTVVQE